MWPAIPKGPRKAVSPSRLRKRLARAFMVSWREQPTRYDIEALQANIRRVGLVIRVRWVLIAVLALYSVLAAGLYATRMPISELASLMWIPAVALGFVVVYNTFYSLNYRRLGNIAVWNNLQLILDVAVVSVLVYFSGGVNSWFWSMYSLFILEATFILPRSRDAWLIALGCIVVLGAMEWLEFAGILPHIDIPFASNTLYYDGVFVSVRYLWQAAVLAGTAWICNLLVGEFRRDLAARSQQSIIDLSTGLYSRGYFMRAYPAEIRRAGRDNRPVHLFLLDIDRFGDFNARFGIERGDHLLKGIATAISEVVGKAGDVMSTSNLAARIGGEEFAILVAEDQRLHGTPRPEEGIALAEQVRAAIQAVQVDGAGVTVSVGVATLPKDGATADELLDAADAALSASVDAGGNRVTGAADAPQATSEFNPADQD